MTDFWPEEFGHETVVPPVVMLREQAKALAIKTKGLVIADVESKSSKNGFRHEFYLAVPTFEDYRYELFNVFHDVILYPARVEAYKVGKMTCESPESLERVLKQILSSETTISVVRSLMAQASLSLQPSE